MNNPGEPGRYRVKQLIFLLTEDRYVGPDEGENSIVQLNDPARIKSLLERGIIEPLETDSEA